MKKNGSEIKRHPSSVFPSVIPMREWLADLVKATNAETVLIRVDAGKVPGLSFGHLARCLMISDLLTDSFGVSCRFLMKDIPEGVDCAVKAGKLVKTISVNSPAKKTERELLKYASQTKPDIVIIDLPDETTPSLFQELRNLGIKSMILDDIRFFNPGADIYLNTSILAPKRFKQTGNTFTTNLLGPEYFIFNPPPKSKTISFNRKKKNLIISFGGSDPKHITQKCLELLVKQKWTESIFHVILGPGFGDPAPVSSLISESRASFQLITAPDEIIPYFQAADLAVCAGGRTMYELICLKKKFIPIGSTESEAEAIQEFVRQGWVDTAIPLWNTTDFTTLGSQLNQLGFC